ncbi:MAG: glycogen synthase GlgA [Geminicoccaceae bacterium]
MRVLSVASELFPLLKTGGLADVAGALPGALAPFGVDMRSLLPAYPAVLQAVGAGREVAELATLPGGPGRLRAVEHDGRVLYLLDAPQLFDRPGNPYVDATGTDWPDNGLRFAALAWAAARIGQGGRGGDPAWQPAIVHCHDWQAGLAPAYLRLGNAGAGTGVSPRTVMTIHNLAFQGQFPPALLADLDLPGTAFRTDGLEYYGSLGFLKAGLYYADKLTTVSPTYALEIQTPDRGMGLDGLLRARSADLLGIVNGIDEAVWNPATDPFLPVAYDVAGLERKAGNKRALQERLGLAVDATAFLCSVVSRLSHQKGMDLLLESLPTLLAGGGQLALLGSGDAGLAAAFQAAAERHAGQVACVLGYDEPLSHLLQGGADAILVPSRFEPCGLTQLYGLRYGTLPIVARTGGLADTVIDANHAALAAGVADGLQFAPVTAEALRFALQRALELFRAPDRWRAMQAFAMRQPVGWQASAERYAALYRTLAATGRESGGSPSQ